MTAAKRRSSSGASQLGDDQHQHHHSQQYHSSTESRQPLSDADEQQSPPPYSSASSSSHHLGNYSTHNHHAQHNYHGHQHHSHSSHYSHHHHHQYQQLPQHGHHSDDAAAADEHLQQHLHHHHQQQQPHHAAARDCSVKLPLDILWLPKSAMKPAGPDSPHTDCILVVGVSRPKLAAVFLTVMLISLFLTFHVLYDSAVYNIQAAQVVSEQHRLALLSGNRLPDYGGNKQAAESSNQISHPMVFPSNRVHFPKTSRRLPQALIIGIRKCGTRALLEMLYLHPRIQKAGGEVHFFDRDENYLKGLEWYRKKMPHSFRGQITIEKSPSYFVSPEVPERVRAMNASIKLLLIVREPVTRAISDYTQLRSHAATASSLPPIAPDGGNGVAAPAPIGSGSGLGALYAQQQQQQKSAHSLLYQKLHGPAGLQSLSSAQVYDNSIGGGGGGGAGGDEHPPHHGHAADGTTTPTPASAAAAAAAAQMAAKSFEELALFPNGTVNESYRPLTISMYHLHLHRWLEVFPREQLLVVNGDRLIDDPVSQLQRIENFLGIEHRVTSGHFYFNETKGFYCLRYDNGDRCLRETKGRKHPHVDPVVVSKLRKFFAEHNQRFYELVGEDLGWPEE